MSLVRAQQPEPNKGTHRKMGVFIWLKTSWRENQPSWFGGVRTRTGIYSEHAGAEEHSDPAAGANLFTNTSFVVFYFV
jgi:hypothetical protein